jgi:ribosomal protein L11
MIQIISKLKLKIFSGKASSLPPIGPILGQNAINCARFCNDFNAITKKFSLYKEVICSNTIIL